MKTPNSFEDNDYPPPAKKEKVIMISSKTIGKIVDLIKGWHTIKKYTRRK